MRKKNQVIIFDDVDVAVMVEKEIAGLMQATNYIVRGANSKSMGEINEELVHVKDTEIGKDGAMNEIEQIFWKFPRFLRKIFWFISRRKSKSQKTICWDRRINLTRNVCHRARTTYYQLHPCLLH